MKYAIEPRREIGIRTVFNLLGPLTNPACANAQLLGVYDAKLTTPMAYALQKLGCEEAMVVHGIDGLDEVSTIGKTVLAHLKEGKVITCKTVPKDFGVKKARIADLQVATLQESAQTLFEILYGHLSLDDPKVEFVLVNSAAGIIVGGEAENFQDGMTMARRSIESGSAYGKLKTLIKASNGSLEKLEELEAQDD
jgi:anthranilate phosphoribosyltransferase